MTTRMTLVMLAVTHMKTGICIAGVRQDAPATWIRPVRDFGSILLGDVTYPGGTPTGTGPSQRRVMRPFDIVEFGLGHARPAAPHIEDWTCDFAHQRPRLLGVVPESARATLLDAACYPADTLWHGARSLGALGALAVDDLTATFRHDTYSGAYEARLAFAGLPPHAANAACTDLQWRALGHRLLAPPSGASCIERTSSVRLLTLTGAELANALGGPRRIWLALGLSRALNGRDWPLVVGVHTLPDYEADIDYTNP